MTIHEEHPAPLINKGGWEMKTTIVNCDFCPAVIHDGAYYEFRTCDMSQAVQICPRCMAIFGDEVRKKRMKE